MDSKLATSTPDKNLIIIVSQSETSTDAVPSTKSHFSNSKDNELRQVTTYPDCRYHLEVAIHGKTLWSRYTCDHNS